jgi:hypothetical protein
MRDGVVDAQATARCRVKAGLTFFFGYGVGRDLVKFRIYQMGIHN